MIGIVHLVDAVDRSKPLQLGPRHSAGWASHVFDDVAAPHLYSSDLVDEIINTVSCKFSTAGNALPGTASVDFC